MNLSVTGFCLPQIALKESNRDFRLLSRKLNVNETAKTPIAHGAACAAGHYYHPPSEDRLCEVLFDSGVGGCYAFFL